MKSPLRTSLAILVFLGIVSASGARADVSDYDPVTGEPECSKCHTGDRKYSIDYTLDSTCSECHGNVYSDKFNAIDGRYKQGEDEAKNFAGFVQTASGKDPAAPAQKTARKKKNGSTKDMALVPGGPFTMGSNEWWPKCQPEHKAIVEAFYMDRHEVTNIRYKAFADATNRPTPEHWIDGNIPKGKEDHPVVNVSWHDAADFCKWEGKRLPGEKEWEKAARGSDARIFPWGNEFDKNKGNTPQYGRNATMPVGSFENGKSPYGIYDMAGNVWEWVDDWFKPYPGNQHPDENYGERYRVLRGGSWYDCTYYKCGISAPTYNRIFFAPDSMNNNFGFRCAKDK